MAEQEDEGQSLAADGPESGWQLLLALAGRAKAGDALAASSELRVQGGQLALDDGGLVHVDLNASRCWSWRDENSRPSPELTTLLDLYMPLCVGQEANRMVVAHLGTTLDGRIATHNGASQFITGEENLLHAHRMRALFDAVIVGARTANSDDPQLTTRLTSGEHPTRILIDPRCTVAQDAAIFTDGVSETLVICDQAFLPEGSQVHIGLPSEDGVIAPRAIIDALAARGLRRLFLEGGGVTVSQFLSAGVLDRLHVCVAPMIIGSGRPAFQLPEVDSLAEGIFLDVRHFASGPDILFDCRFRKVS